MKTIGIIGGMGPEATAALYLEIVHIFQRRFNARYDADYPPMVIYNLPAPDVVEEVGNEGELLRLLIDAARKLEKAGAEFFLLACNTVQKHLPSVAAAVDIPFIDLNVEIASAAKKAGWQRLGILGTEATLSEGHLAEACRQKGVESLLPEPLDRRELTRIIMGILSGNPDSDARRSLLGTIASLEQRGAQAVVLACTDLRLLLQHRPSPIPLLDTVDLLAEAAVGQSMD